MQTYMNSTNTLEAGHICDCGKQHEWELHIYTKWKNQVPHTCECGIKSIIVNGTVTKKELEGNNG